MVLGHWVPERVAERPLTVVFATSVVPRILQWPLSNYEQNEAEHSCKEKCTIVLHHSEPSLAPQSTPARVLPSPQSLSLISLPSSPHNQQSLCTLRATQVFL